MPRRSPRAAAAPLSEYVFPAAFRRIGWCFAWAFAASLVFTRVGLLEESPAVDIVVLVSGSSALLSPFWMLGAVIVLVRAARRGHYPRLSEVILLPTMGLVAVYAVVTMASIYERLMDPLRLP